MPKNIFAQESKSLRKGLEQIKGNILKQKISGKIKDLRNMGKSVGAESYGEVRTEILKQIKT